jgi:hypothetical protein
MAIDAELEPRNASMPYISRLLQADREAEPNYNWRVPTGKEVTVVATQYGVHSQDIYRLRQLRRRAIPEIILEIENGVMSLTAAQRLIKSPNQAEALLLWRDLSPDASGRRYPKQRALKRPSLKQKDIVIDRVIGALKRNADLAFSLIDSGDSIEQCDGWANDLSEVIGMLKRIQKVWAFKGEDNGRNITA